MVRGKTDKIFNMGMTFVGLMLIFNVAWVLIFIISASVSSPKEVVMGRVFLIPKGFSLDAYKTVLEQSDVWIGYKNTIIYTILGTAIKVFVTLITAYPLSIKGMKGKGVFFAFLMLTMYFNGGLIPTFMLIKSLNLYDSMWALILPSAVVAYNVIICRTFFQTNIPVELQESAKIDGASDFFIFLKIVIPLSAPIIAVLVLFFAVGHWNQFFEALIYLRSRSKFPLQIFLREILIMRHETSIEYSTVDEMLAAQKLADEAEMMKYSLIIVSSLPFLIAYPMLQKYFIKGIMVGAIKG